MKACSECRQLFYFTMAIAQFVTLMGIYYCFPGWTQALANWEQDKAEVQFDAEELASC